MMYFGEFIKKRRLQQKMGLRNFAEKIGEDAGNWCRIEKGQFSAPSDIKILNKICMVLDISDREKIYDLAAMSSKSKIPVDIKSQIQKNEIVPILFRTIGKKKLSQEQMRELVQRIKNEY